MTFQFLCPQGDLLQAEESQTGQQYRCPYCGSEFLVPQAPPADPSPTPPLQAAHEPPVHEEPAAATREPPQEAFPGIRTDLKIGGEAAADVAAQLGSVGAEQQSLLHIPCPKGHLLETPREMLGKDAMCPFCRAEFRLRFQDSQEYRQEKEKQQARREQKLGKAWLHWAIAAAVVVVLGVIVLVAVANLR